MLYYIKVEYQITTVIYTQLRNKRIKIKNNVRCEMKEETRQFLEDDKFNRLYDALYEMHKPKKANLKRDNLQAIGKIIVSFQRMEMTICQFIGILANFADDQSLVNIFTAKLSFRNLLSVLHALAVAKDFHRLDDLSTLLRKADKAEDIRNQIVHSVWSTGPRFKTNISGKKGVIHQSEIYEDGELEQIAGQIRKIDTAIEALCFDYIDWCHKNGNTPKGVRYICG